jgi:hypothetical protein
VSSLNLKFFVSDKTTNKIRTLTEGRIDSFKRWKKHKKTTKIPEPFLILHSKQLTSLFLSLKSMYLFPDFKLFIPDLRIAKKVRIHKTPLYPIACHNLSLNAVLRIHQIHIILGLPDPLVSMDPDPSIIKQK